MVASLLTSVALLASAASVSALGLGSAQVVNACPYDVFLTSVPSAGGGFSSLSAILSSGQSWSQQWTALSNGNGWSIKLSKTPILGDDILQYEYTYQNDGIIWYDLSCVNGSPWDSFWDLTADTDTCDPKHQAYEYSTDDAHGMQASCPQNNVITVTLCSDGNSTDSSAAPWGSSSSSAPATTAEASSASAPAQSTDAPFIPILGSLDHVLQGPADKAADSAPSAVVPTTFSTITSAPAAPASTDAPGANPNVITHVQVEIVTEIVTQYADAPGRRRRHEHHARGHY